MLHASCALLSTVLAQSTFTPTTVVRQALNAMLNTTDANLTDAAIQKYFSPSYTQYTDSSFYDYQNFTEFMKSTKVNLQSVDFNIYWVTGLDSPVDYGNTTIFQVGVYESIVQRYVNYTLHATGIEVVGVQNGTIVENHEAIDLVTL